MNIADFNELSEVEKRHFYKCQQCGKWLRCANWTPFFFMRIMSSGPIFNTAARNGSENRRTSKPALQRLSIVAPPHFGQGAAISASAGRVKCFVCPQAVHFQASDLCSPDCSISLSTESA